MSYCSAIATMSAEKQAIHKPYHDLYYGFPIHDDNELFCRLVLEINQAGLSWETILKKESTFRLAYHNFEINTVANYSEADVARLMGDSGIIRNRLKINAAIENARTIIGLQESHRSFRQWLEQQHPKTKDEWVKLFKQTFRFTGGEIVSEFLMSIGYLPGAHDENCPVYHQVLGARPAWAPVQPTIA